MALTLSNVRKAYPSPDGTVLTVLDIDYFALASGEQVALIGSSGSGKTTLLHSIAGILSPDGGQILIKTSAAEQDITRLSEADRDVFRGSFIGYIFQTHHLLPGFTALENVLLGMSFTGRDPDKAWATHLLKEVGLGDRLNYTPAKLSIGQQQRVAVARALASKPSLVLADEPTGALDEENAQQVLDLIRKLCQEVNASLLLVTHDMGIARQLPRQVNLAEINKAAKKRVSSS